MGVIRHIEEALKPRTKQYSPRRSYFYVCEAGRTPYEIFKDLSLGKSFSTRMLRALDNGRHVHNRLRGYLQSQGVVKAMEVEVKTKLFRGRADAIVYEDGSLAVLEIKSIRKQDFEKLTKFVPWMVYAQVQLYMNYLNIDKALVLFECKDDQRLKEYVLKRKPKTAREIIDKFSKLKTKLVEDGVMGG